MSHSIKQLADYTGVFELVGVKCRLYIAWKIVTVYCDIFGVSNTSIEIPIPPNFKVNIRHSNNKWGSFAWTKGVFIWRKASPPGRDLVSQ